MTEFWKGLGLGRQIGLVVGVVLVIAATVLGGWWMLKPEYKVLFSDLRPQDSAAMAGELDKLKIPYEMQDAGAVILVDKSQVHVARIKLMDKDLALHGAVGFELFNTTDFGMTEFAQKINYQRALQGELTRTIMALAEVRDVRVHLALPEQGLFKQATAKAKAAITLTMREGKSLRPEQVLGIQRLVAAATPGMVAQDVTVVDRQGIALSRVADEGADAAGASAGAGNAGLELKKDTEAQLVRKANAVLERAFGAGQALASVDVTLNMDQVRTTTEDVVPAPSRTAESKGVIVKERESVRDGAPPLDTVKVAGGSAGGSTQREVDYQVGRRVEQVVSGAGAIRRIQIVAVVRQSLDASQEQQIRALVGAAVGAVPGRGDTVVIQSLHALLPAAKSGDIGAVAGEETLRDVQGTPSVGGHAAGAAAGPAPALPYLAGALVLAVLVLGAVVLARRERGQGALETETARPLTEAERAATLDRIQAWMANGQGTPGVDTVPMTGRVS